MEKNQRSIDQLIDLNTKEEGPVETYWVDLDILSQEHLDDITAIYCQVFKKSPKELNCGLELGPLVSDVSDGLGFHELRIGGFQGPGLDVRRISIGVVANETKFAVRFGTTIRGEVFQKAVDEYLRDSAKIAKSLSQISLEEKSGPQFIRRNQFVQNPSIT